MRVAVQIQIQAEQPNVDRLNEILREATLTYFPGKKKPGSSVPMQLHGMEPAARQKDTRQLYNLAKRIAPKSNKTAAQLIDEAGHILSKQQEADKLTEFYTEVFKHQHALPQPVSVPVQLNVSRDELERQFRNLSAFKAAPAALAPAAMEGLPGRCHTLAYLAKPIPYSHSPNMEKQLGSQITRLTLPRQLRPTGLAEISGRLVAGVIQDRLLPHVQKYLENLPQFAYLPERSTKDATRRAQTRCVEIYKACRGRDSSVLEKYRGC